MSHSVEDHCDGGHTLTLAGKALSLKRLRQRMKSSVVVFEFSHSWCHNRNSGTVKTVRELPSAFAGHKRARSS